MNKVDIHQGDVLQVLRSLPAESIHCCITSPPYWGLRSYGTPPQIWGGDEECEHEWGNEVEKKRGAGGEREYSSSDGSVGRGPAVKLPSSSFCCLCGAWRGDLGLEPTIELFVEHLVTVFREVRRVLRADGTLWLNLGDSYANDGKWGGSSGGKHVAALHGNTGIGRQKVTSGLKPKDLCMIPARVALALQADGWWLRSDIIWAKKSPMPESCTDRPTSAYEHIFLLTKSPRYFYDAEAVREKAVGQNHHDLTGCSYQAPGQTKQTGSRGHGFQGRQGGSERVGPQSGGVGSEEWTPNPGGRNLRNVWLLGPEPFTDWYKTVRQVPVERDAVSDGMKHKVSPDCPVHGCLCRQDSSRPDDGHEADAQTRNGHNGGRLSQEQLFDCAPTGPKSGECLPLSNSDCQDQPCSPSAIDHSIGNRKTAPAPETSSPYISSAEIPCRIADKSDVPGCASDHPGTSGCKPLPGDSDVHPSVQISDRIVDKSSLPIPPECLCSFYQEVTEKSSHFATFPSELVRRCVAAGTSEKGRCPKCGAPWKRVVEKGTEPAASHKGSKFALGKTGVNGQGRTQPGERFLNQITGWRPTCKCPHTEVDLIPVTVLDPFGGSGTTGLVAAKMGRDAVLIELKPEYCEMTAKRIKGDLGMLAEVEILQDQRILP